jgi:hypothetical protein
MVSSDALYKLCNTPPLSDKSRPAKMVMFGHVLMMPEETPAQRALEFALLGASKYKARRRHQCIHLLSMLCDLKKAGLGTLKSRMELMKLRISAEDKRQWTKAKV